METKNQILYLFDPLCGWCYGFSETMMQFYGQHREQFEFVAIPGGMVTGERVGPISQMESFITNAYKNVEEKTGVKYGDAYLNGILKSKTTLLDSEPPSRALHTLRTFQFEMGIEFAHAIQKAHYFDGLDFNDESIYGPIAESFGISSEEFYSRFNAKEMKQNVQQEFAWAKESGVQGYPTVVLRHGQKYYMLAHGFMPLDQLNEALVKAQKMLATEVN